MIDHTLYNKSFILGETDDINKRQLQYNKIQKGLQKPNTGTIVSMTNEAGLIFPFVDCFKFTLPGGYTKNKHDSQLHYILQHEKPFTDIVYHIKDKTVMNTKEAFAFYSTNDLIYDIERLKNFLIENLLSYHSYSIVEYKYT